MSTGEIPIQILTLIIALYAATFSTILAIRQGSPRVAVRFDVGDRATAEGAERVVTVSALNIGNRALEIRELGFNDELGATLSKRFDPPKLLEVGRSIEQPFGYEEVLGKLDDFTAIFAEDASRRSYSDDLSANSKDLIRYRAEEMIQHMANVARNLKQASRMQVRAQELLESIPETLAHHDEELQAKLRSIEEEHQEYREYEDKTGEMHPELREYIDNIVRGVEQRDHEAASEDQEGGEQRRESC